MKMLALQLLVLLAVGALADPVFPTWPNDYSGLSKEEVFIAQGPAFNYHGAPLDGVCCFNKTNCAVQIQYQSGRIYIDRENQRVRQDLGDPSQFLVTLFAEQRQYYVIGQQCSSYCPINATMSTTTQFVDPQASYKDRSQCPFVAGAPTLDTYQESSVFPIINITMETETWWLDLSTSPATPAVDFLDQTPFGMQQGNDTQIWSDMQWGQPDAALFAFNGKATCPQDANCGQSTRAADVRRPLTRRDVPRAVVPLRKRGDEEAANALPVKPTLGDVFTTPAPKPPLLPSDWTAVLCDELLQAQYTFNAPNGAKCCPHKHNCQVQYQYGCTHWYYDYTNQRARLDADAGQYTLKLYNESTLFNVGANGKCVSQCPIDTSDTMETAFFTGNGAALTYAGQQPWDGKTYETWTWNEISPFGQLIAHGLGYYDTTTTPYTPVADVENVVIAGAIATSTTHSLQWGTPAADKFQCVGCDYNCPTADDCQQQAFNSRRASRFPTQKK